MLAREPAPLGESLRRDGIELVLGVHATSAARDGEDFVLQLEDGRELRGDHLLVATGRRPRVEGLGLETVGITPDARGIRVDSHLRAGERLWAIGDVTGLCRRSPRLPPTLMPTYTHAYAESNGFLTLLSDGERLTGAYALGPEAGEWMQQMTLAIRASVPLEVLRDTIQPFPSFSEIVAAAVKALRSEIAGTREAVGAGAS